MVITAMAFFIVRRKTILSFHLPDVFDQVRNPRDKQDHRPEYKFRLQDPAKKFDESIHKKGFYCSLTPGTRKMLQRFHSCASTLSSETPYGVRCCSH
jgi:hypothetical protein